MSKAFASKLLRWFDQHGRHDLPWQKNRNLYRVWVAEIMLQQTQVKTVIPYYRNFMRRFPNLKQLASASQDEVLRHWAGLGYYSRARNLHKAAITVSQDYAGRIPRQPDVLVQLPGIGRSTAAAILSQALDQRHAILDGNVKRVLARYRAISGWPGNREIEQRLWELAEQLTPAKRSCDYTQAIMDLGATLCTRSQPSCESCPVRTDCMAWQSNSVLDYPTRKAKKTLPVKQLRFLILTDQSGAVLLEKRPPSGIWGGLWSLPEAEPESDIAAACLQRWGIRVTRPQHGDSFRHTFSHYHLDILPCRLQLETSADAVRCDASTKWVKLDAQNLPAVAAPVARLLNEYAVTS